MSEILYVMVCFISFMSFHHFEKPWKQTTAEMDHLSARVLVLQFTCNVSELAQQNLDSFYQTYLFLPLLILQHILFSV